MERRSVSEGLRRRSPAIPRRAIPGGTTAGSSLNCLAEGDRLPARISMVTNLSADFA